LVNVDVADSNTNLWFGSGILFAVKGTKNIAVGYANFNNEEIIYLNKTFYSELQFDSNCFSGLIYSQTSDVIIDCQHAL
jgi:hypothetical protein